MADREKVIKGLEICIKYIDRDCPIGCPYYEICTKYEGSVVFQPVLMDALALLKEQPEIVRCKDCRYYHGRNEGCGGMGVYPPSGDWFCTDGERL